MLKKDGEFRIILLCSENEAILNINKINGVRENVNANRNFTLIIDINQAFII